jgi:hypothetical protein
LPIGFWQLVLAPVLSAVHLYSVTQEMRAAPINTLNAQRTAMLVADFIKTGIVSRPADLRYKERLILPVSLLKDAGNVRVVTQLKTAIGKPSRLTELKQRFHNKRFLLNFRQNSTDLVLHQLAKGEDAVEAWLMAANVARLSKESDILSLSDSGGVSSSVFEKAYEETEKHLPALLSGLREHGWHTHLFLEGNGVRAVW